MSKPGTEDALLTAVSENLPTNLRLTVKRSSNNEDYDGLATLTVGRDQTFDFKIEIKSIHRKENLFLLKKAWHDDATAQRLLICPHLTAAQAEICEELRLNFIDAAGNASIVTKGLFLRISGKKPVKSLTNSDNSAARISEGTLKLLLVLLNDEQAINATYRELSAAAGISLGMVSKAFEYLESQRYYRKSKGGRRLLSPESLTALWLREYAVMIRPKLKRLNLVAPTYWQDLTLKPSEIWGGEAAAALLTEGYLYPETLMLFTHTPLQQRRKELGMHPQQHGSLQMTGAFWGETLKLSLRSQAMLSIAELLASRDSRNLEVARMINDKYLGLTDSALFRD